MKKQTIRLPFLATLAAKANEWLHSENRIVSAVMEERVTNRQVLHYVNFGLPFVLALGCTEVQDASRLFTYSALAYQMAKKGGKA